MSSSGERYNWWSEDNRWRTDGHRLFLTFVCITCSLQVRTDDGQTVIDWWSEDDYSPYLFPDVRIHYLQFTSMCEPAQMYRQKQMPGVRRMTDRRSLSGSLNVTAGSGIRDSEGGATYIIQWIFLLMKERPPNSLVLIPITILDIIWLGTL